MKSGMEQFPDINYFKTKESVNEKLKQLYPSPRECQKEY
jgi:hypothetical protein